MLATLDRLLRRLETCDFDMVMMDGCDADDEVDEEESVKEDVEAHALAQCEMARSTMVDIAPSLPRNTEELELELEEEDELEEIDSGRGVLGGDDGSGTPPR